MVCRVFYLFIYIIFISFIFLLFIFIYFCVCSFYTETRQQRSFFLGEKTFQISTSYLDTGLSYAPKSRALPRKESLFLLMILRHALKTIPVTSRFHRKSHLLFLKRRVHHFCDLSVLQKSSVGLEVLNLTG